MCRSCQPILSVWPFLLLVVMASLLGCQGEKPSDTSSSNLANISNFYTRYRGHHRGQRPKDEQEFRKYVLEKEAAILESIGIKNPEDVFISERDNQPYVLLFGKDIVRTSEGEEVIGYEQQGKNGTRFVGYEGGYVAELSEEEFGKIVKP